ncbi:MULTISPECIES: serine hydrolase domain-containing protein [unclassified Streptomyces]|uniref:serine hydrolase domain-containing protein n=1 Tax=unclassified Streptomyces TaxID=2593676 RepID=UPI0036E7F13D
MLDDLGARCARAMAEHGSPSVSVAVAARGEVILAEAYGLADTGARIPATAHTPYAVASATKPVTAAAVCVAADEGLLDLDAPGPLGATPRQLLRHRGGLGAHYDFHYGEQGEPAVDPEPYTRLSRAPGSGFEYANLGYRLLGRLLEEATGQDLATYAHERVLGPLGLDGFRIATHCPGAATRYTCDGRAYPQGLRTSHPGASLGWATAPQLALFAQTWPRLLKPETAAAVLDAVPIGEHLGYGLGWCVSRGDGPLLVSHGGGMGGVAAMTVSAPELGLSVAVLTNTTVKAARDAVVNHVLGELVPGYGPERISPVFSVPGRPMALPEEEWAGRVESPEGDIPVELRVLAGGRAELRIAGEAVTADVEATDTLALRGTFPVQLPTADARVSSPLLGIELGLVDGVLRGRALAYRNGDSDGFLGNLLTHPCELRTQPASFPAFP